MTPRQKTESIISGICQYRVVFPGVLNDRNSLFGGEMMKWMDETAYVNARLYTGQEMVTIQAQKIMFLQALHQGDIARISSEIRSIRSSRLEIQVSVHKIPKGSCSELVAEGIFMFAALNGNGIPVRIHVHDESSEKCFDG